MKQNNAHGIYWMLFHGITLTLMFALGKLLTGKVHLMQMIFVYNLVAFVIVTCFMCFAGFIKVKSSKIHMHFIRSFLNISGYISYFYGLQFTTLDSATSITYLLPILVSYLGSIFFRERLSKTRIASLILGIIGIIIILKPGTQSFEISSIWIFVSVIAWSGSDLVTKKLGKTENAFGQVFFSTLFGSILSLPLAIYYWETEIIIDDFFIISMIGLLSLFATGSIFKSLQHADFSVVMPFDYFRLPFSTLLGYLMFQEVMAINTIIGSIIIVIAGFYLLHYENKKRHYIPSH